MRFEGKLRRLCAAALSLSVRLAFAVFVLASSASPTSTATAQATAPGQPDVARLDAVGGRAWHSCALGVGLIVGGILGMGVNPLGGATAISIGGHMALFFCT